jgi:uncharacterized protein
MRTLAKRFGWLRIVAMAMAVSPLLLLPILGTLWLWQSEWLLVWLLAAGLATAVGLALNQVAIRKEQQALPDDATLPNPLWSADAERCWQDIEELAARETIEQWPLSDGSGLLKLARKILVQVAVHFHPQTRQPLLEMTLPHTLAIIERAAAELRRDITEHIPFSHQLSLGDMARAGRLRDWYKRHEGWYRAGRALIAPQSALIAELRRSLGNQAFQHGSKRIQQWLLREYIRKLGFHAIELYGGFARLDEGVALDQSVRASADDRDRARSRSQSDDEPVRILMLGRANAGKSSLINALFGELRSATDVLPDTTAEITAYELERQGQRQALIFDTPGFDGALFGHKVLAQTVKQADLIIWVSAANRPDRDQERTRLDQIRDMLSTPSRRPAPIVVAMSHIDRLRPVREWSPPYDLNQQDTEKARNIVAAVQALARDLAIETDRIVPVCLAEDRIYNVDDAFWAVLLEHYNEADRARLLRCLRERQREENWQLLRRQLINTGRWLKPSP